MITENYIFLCILKGDDITVTANEITEDEIQLLFKHEIMVPFAPGFLKARFLAVANYPIINTVIDKQSKRLKGDHVILRKKK